MVKLKDKVHDQFDEQTVAYMDNAKAKKRVTKTCKHCKKTFVFRNVGQLVCHLAAPDNGVGKASGCASVPPEVKMRYRRRLAEAEIATLLRSRRHALIQWPTMPPYTYNQNCPPPQNIYYLFPNTCPKLRTCTRVRAVENCGAHRLWSS